MPGRSTIWRICRLWTFNPKWGGGGFRGPFCAPTEGVPKCWFGDQFCLVGGPLRKKIIKCRNIAAAIFTTLFQSASSRGSFQTKIDFLAISLILLVRTTTKILHHKLVCESIDFGRSKMSLVVCPALPCQRPTTRIDDEGRGLSIEPLFATKAQEQPSQSIRMRRLSHSWWPEIRRACSRCLWMSFLY